MKYLVRVLIVVFAMAAPAISQTDNERLATDINNQGVGQYTAKQYPQAVESFKRAIDLLPGNATFHINLGQIVRQMTAGASVNR